VYIFAGDTYCNRCALEIREQLREEGKAPDDPDDEWSFGSDDFPKGPYNDAEEADSPQHCAACGHFFRNDLTEEGVRYLRELAKKGRILPKWAEYYADHLSPPENDERVTVQDIIAYENGELDIDETICLFRLLVRTGMIHHLQGHYQRTARVFMREGLI